MGIRVGIDLGTTFSAVTRISDVNGKPEIIKNSFGSSITPSVLCFEENGNVLFGEDAKSMQGMGNTNAIAFFKRYMGNDQFCVEILGKTYNAEDLSAIFLEKLVKEAEQCCGEKIDAAVITVPAYFTHKERQATISAGKKAGLDVLAIINEPTAAAFAYGLNNKDCEQTVLIYDLGGGTFDVTIARIDKEKIDVLGSDGNHELGGKDWDDCIARYLAQQFYENYHVDLSEDEKIVASLIVAAEAAKKQLTVKDKVTVPIIYKDIKGKVTITEEMFEDVSEFLIGATKELTNNLIESINLSWKDITGVILVGGSTRMRMIHNYVRDMSGREPLAGVNVDEAVALGAAIRANIDDLGKTIVPKLPSRLRGEKSVNVIGAKKVSDVTTHALGMIAISEDGERYENSVIIPKNTSIPAFMTRSYNFKTSRKNNELEVYVLQGDLKRPLDNTIIDKYVLTQIENINQNPSVIEVLYKYNSNGVIDVSAVQKETGKALPVRIEKVPEDMSWTDMSPKERASAIPKPVIEVILAVDLSGSMYGRPIKKAQSAMKSFVKEMNPEITKIGVQVFADTSRILLKPTNNYRKVIKKINNVDYEKVGFGNYAEPFTDALSEMKINKLDEDSNKIRYLVVLTDGVWFNTKRAVRIARECHEEGIEIMALGFGSADEGFLRKIASTDEFASLSNLSELTESFSKIAQIIGDGESYEGIKMI